MKYCGPESLAVLPYEGESGAFDCPYRFGGTVDWRLTTDARAS